MSNKRRKVPQISCFASIGHTQKGKPANNEGYVFGDKHVKFVGEP